ncbi:MAG: DUF3500 domain-containing protein [Burkholderiales bacterium]|nr:DUF3500 domain-containing protein [Burkholderiales bacterium]
MPDEARAQAAPSPVAAARRLIDAAAPAQRGLLLHPFTDAARSDWHYTPRRRDGLAWKAMPAALREATTALMRTALNERGLDKVRAVMALEITLRELEAFGLSRDPENYALAIYGEPGAGSGTAGSTGGGTGSNGWGWRIEGHHLSLHFSLEGDRVVSTLPQFFGANPAVVPRDVAGGAPRDMGGTPPRAGFRLLGTEEDLARQWLAGLSPAQRGGAIFDTRPYGDVVSRNAARAKPLDAVGLPWGEMDPAQQAQVLKLIGAFADHLQPELAEARLARVRAAPLESVRIGWAGSLQPREPHYFRIQGANFLIEFDNSGGNHIHSVWRDFEGDFGRDVLREHYRRAEGGGHRHGSR